MSHRKTAHIVCAALWVYDQSLVNRLVIVVRTIRLEQVAGPLSLESVCDILGYQIHALH